MLLAIVEGYKVEVYVSDANTIWSVGDVFEGEREVCRALWVSGSIYKGVGAEGKRTFFRLLVGIDTDNPSNFARCRSPFFQRSTNGGRRIVESG